MQKIDSRACMLAGFGIGLAATVLFAPQSGVRTRRRIRGMANLVTALPDKLKSAAGDYLEEGRRTFRDAEVQGSQTMSDWKDKAKEKIDDVVESTRTSVDHVVDQVADKARDVAHQTGKKLEETGKRLQDV